MNALFINYQKLVTRIAHPMIVSGAFVGGYTGMYMAHEDAPNNMAKTWLGGWKSHRICNGIYISNYDHRSSCKSV